MLAGVHVRIYSHKHKISILRNKSWWFMLSVLTVMSCVCVPFVVLVDRFDQKCTSSSLVLSVLLFLRFTL